MKCLMCGFVLLGEVLAGQQGCCALNYKIESFKVCVCQISPPHNQFQSFPCPTTDESRNDSFIEQTATRTLHELPSPLLLYCS